MRISFNRKASKPLLAALAIALVAVISLYAATSFPTAGYSKAQALSRASEAAGSAQEASAPAAAAHPAPANEDQAAPTAVQKENPPGVGAAGNASGGTVAAAPDALEAEQANGTPILAIAERSAAAASASAQPAQVPAASQPQAAQASGTKGLLSQPFTYVLAGAVVAIALLLSLFKVSFAPEMAYDAAIFKTLSSDTRMELLASLQERRKTLSELARETEISLPGAKQHLGLLEEAGLIRKLDEGRKWKYYELTPQGKTILAERYS